MEDTIEVKLPKSEKLVVIRNYTTRKDDLKAEEALYRGVDVKAKTQSTEGANVDFPISNVMASKAVSVRRLVQSIDGDSTNLESQLENLRTEDYEVIDDAVQEILDKYSPKA